MSKVSIIYWSNGGNVEKLANSIAEGVKMSNVEVDIKHVNDSSVDEVLEAGAVALGSPAMVEDDIERIDMKPFINKLSKLNIKNKPVVLFGSCGWKSSRPEGQKSIIFSLNKKIGLSLLDKEMTNSGKRVPKIVREHQSPRIHTKKGVWDMLG